ncbi:MAG: right-handed parallel beta-helix repeat-containing protein [Sediminibacterium sp.]
MLISFCSSLFAESIDLKAGMVIRNSVNINPARYFLNASVNNQEPLLTIDGNNIVVDFSHAILQGSNDKTRPDEFYGLSILIKKGSRNITIKNAEIHGYKVAILADSVTALNIDNCDLSYNWRQRLQSNLEREDVSDWMSYHKNDNDEWLRYGAAIYLKNCTKATITNNMVTGGQCALMMTKCENAQVTDNNFSFNSGIGIGLYRSSNNKIYHNRIDYNVRGYSDGKYKRGQDSAGILVFEQSSHNIFAYNTATHSGDGFFLWAGQTTMDTGQGGCNDNFIYGNDFSYAPTNGIEVTFSQNLIMKNIVKDCDHGIWGGYSYDTDITDNTFENNRIGIAIEHGQNINLVLNSFTNDRTGVKLWSREKQPDDWIYAKKRNTESRNYWIAANRFTGNQKAFDIMGTDTVVFSGNTKVMVEESLVVGDRAENLDTSREEEFLDMDYQKDERLKAIKDTQMPASIVPQGKSEMRITEWGPYDFRYPIVWLKNIDTNGLYHFEILGPKGKWEVTKLNGFTILTKGEGIFPSAITAKVNNNIADRNIQLTYTGPNFRNQFGKIQDSTSNHLFQFKEFQPQATWNISWYKWDDAHDPAKDYFNFTTLFDSTPVNTITTNKIDYTWWGSIGKNLPADSFATVAVTKMFLKENNYQIGITADDYVKLFIDGKEVINAWDSRYTELDENTHHRINLKLSSGEHDFRIVHAENKGLATLQFYIEPVNY